MTEITNMGAVPNNWSDWYQSNQAHLVGGTPQTITLSFNYLPDMDLSTTVFVVQVLYADGTGFKMEQLEFTPEMDTKDFPITIGADTSGYVYARIMAEGVLPTAVQMTSSDGDGFTMVSPSSVPAWTPADPDYTPPEQHSGEHGALSPSVEDALTPYRTAYSQVSPLVIDLSSGHTGITLTEFDAATTTTAFDLTSDGFARQTAWVSGDTGLLVRDLNSNGTIDNGDELFGSPTVDGFAKLAALDTNHDLKIDASDSGWGSLQVWIDSNGDAVTQSGELHSLSSLGITSIDLAGVHDGATTVSGNQISHVSTVTFSDNSTSEIADAWFVNDPANTYYTGTYTLDLDTAFLPALRGYGTLPDFVVAMSQDATLKGLVEDFASSFTMASFSDPETLNSDVADILYQWAGVEDVDPASRGQFVDARQLEFLEHLFGQEFSQRGFSNPFAAGGDNITASWNIAFENFKDDILIQLGASSLFAAPISYDPLTGTITGTPALSESAVGDLVDNAPEAGPDNTAYWVGIAHFIDTIEGLDNLSTDEATWLNSAVYATDNTLTWSDVVTLAEDSGSIIPENFITGTTGADTLEGTSVNDSVSAGASDDTIHGYGGNDSLNGEDGNDTIYGGDGNDIIHGNTGNDVLYGELGNNTLYGDDGNDILTGGPRGNTVYGGAGDDSYVYTAGADDFYSEAYNGTGGSDRIILPAGINSGDVTFYRVSTGGGAYYDLLITFSGGGSIQIQDHFYSSSYAIETLVFNDSSTIDLTTLVPAVLMDDGGATYNSSISADQVVYGGSGADEIVTGTGNDYIDGGAGNDLEMGGAGNDTYIASPGYDTIEENGAGGGGTDTIEVPTGYSESDVTLSRHIGTYGPDTGLVITINGLGEIFVMNQFYSSDYAVENMHFADGDTTISLTTQIIGNVGSSGNDTLNGLTANVGGNWFDGRGGSDSFVGGIGNNTFIIEAGFGTDTIQTPYHTGNTNILSFEGVDPADIRMWTTGNGYLHLQDINDTSHSITINAGVTGSGTGESAIGTYVQQITFDDPSSTTWDLTGGLILTGTSSAETLYGTAYNDTIYSMGGNDTIYGNHGDDTYVFASGFGNSTVNESLGSGDDTIYLTGIDPANVRLWTDTNGYLHIQDTTNPSYNITVNAGQTGSNTHESTIGNYVEHITFDSSYGTTWDLTGALTIMGTSSAEGLYGTAYGDTISGLDGGDTIYGNAGNDNIIGGAGNDYLYGGPGDDTYTFASGWGSDTVSESLSSGNDTIAFTGIDPADVRMYTDTNGYLHLVDTVTGDAITVNAGQTGSNTHESTVGSYVEQVTFDDTNHTTWDLTGALTITGSSSGDNLYGTAYGDVIYGMAGNDTIYGNAGNDDIIGGAGNDNLYGGPGDDTYTFASGWGSDTVSESLNSGNDTISFTGIDPADVRMYTDVSGYLHLVDTVTGDSMTVIAGQTGSNTHESTIGSYVEQVTFDDTNNTVWDLTGGLTITGTGSGESLYGTAYDDTINGMGGADNLYGNAGNDTLNGGSSAEYLYGGPGNDILIGNGGADYLNGGAGADIFVFKAASALGASVTISDFNTGDGDRIDISDVLSGHYNPLQDAIDDFVTVTTSGSNTLLKVDLDGAGGSYSPTQIATISGVTGLNVDDLVSSGHLLVAA